MIPNSSLASNKKQCIPVPKGADFTGRYADQLARFSFQLMLMTASREEYRSGFWMPYSYEKGHNRFGSAWPKVRKAALEYPQIFEFNDHYNCLPEFGQTFPKSVRLAEQVRTGEVDLYQFKRKQPPRSYIDYEDLDKPSRRLVDCFEAFRLPDDRPVFENAWQAFTWAGIEAGYFYATKCEWGRFHSNFTAFKHRNHILHRKLGPTRAIDIKACQPLCLGAAVSLASGDQKDVQRWITLCQESDLYAELGALMGLEVTSEIRNAVKNRFVRMLFERTHQMQGIPEFEVLLEHFPTIAKYLLETKQAFGYQSAATDCQRLESNILIQSVVPKLGRIDAITVHDEFIVAARDAESVKKIISGAFAKHNLYPQFKEAA